ncbi:MAG: hypothetical protein A3G87_01900 [Omnitrophica bacterium RIFCSPLOWO2_12_FULL_50_11]|nr:MAG: hypothetical protein A3G87_01900 [Omnitrophica bacterium RIFCSPLOWO2_12_FULL_50_11]
MSQLRRFKGKGGTILILAGASLFAFITFFALVADFGHIFVTKAELQNVADSAALAAVVDIQNGLAQARQTAVSFGETHRVAGSPILIDSGDIAFGYYDLNAEQFLPGETPTNAITVNAKRTEGSLSGPLTLFFARLFGKDTSNVQAVSIAVTESGVVGVRARGGLIPLAARDLIVDQDGDGEFDLGLTVDILPRNEAPGNFWYLDFNGGSNSNDELQDWIENGYDQDFAIPAGDGVGVWGSVEVEGTTGIRGESVAEAFQAILDKEVFLPVHNGVSGQGANALYNVIAILAVRIVDVNFTGSQSERYVRAELISVNSSALITHPDAPENNSLQKTRLVL